jgi:hypothetical protein
LKELLIDALNFSILSVEDRPFRTCEIKRKFSDKTAKADRKLSDEPSREIEFGDFRTVNGALVPFSIHTKLMGQPTLSIHLTRVSFIITAISALRISGFVVGDWSANQCAMHRR